jgi:hypothetical protein
MPEESKEIIERIAAALLTAFYKLAEPNEDGTTQHVAEMLDGSTCLDGCFDLKEVARLIEDELKHD